MSIPRKYTFNFKTSTLKFEDTYEYGAVDMVGVLKVIAPYGRILYKHPDFDETSSDDVYTPDIDSTKPQMSKDDIVLQWDSAGNFVSGDYAIFYKTWDLTDPETYFENSKEIRNIDEYLLYIPDVSITTTYSCVNSTFSSTDATVYAISGLTLDELVRDHVVVPPSESPLAETEEDAEVISYTPNIWTGEWNSTVTANVTYSDHPLYFVDEWAGTESTTVACFSLATIDSIRTRITNYLETYIGYLDDGVKTLIDTTRPNIEKILMWLKLYDLAVLASDDETADEMIANIATLISCDSSVVHEVVPA